MLYTKHVRLTDATVTELFEVPAGFHVVINYIFINNHDNSTQTGSLFFHGAGGSGRVDIFDAKNLVGNDSETLGNGGGPLFVLHEGEVLKVQTGAASDVEFVVTFDLLEAPNVLVNFA
jgi:hypothetical protein